MSKTENVSPKKKNRNIYVYSMNFLKDTESSSTTNGNWDEKNCTILKKVLQLIKDLPEKERIKKGPAEDPWTLYLNMFQENDSPIPSYLYGYFSSTENGLRTDLLNNITLEITENPKEEGQNELKSTCFSFRFKDGMFLLGEYEGNIATYKRISEYLNEFLQRFKDEGKIETDIVSINLYNILSKDFLEKINSFDRLNQLQLTIDTTQVSGNDDAVADLSNETRTINAGKLTLILARRDSVGLIPAQVKDWVSNIMRRHPVIQGTIKGHPFPGNRNELRLQGINEKFKRTFETNPQGDVIIGQVYDSFAKINDDHSKLF
jgi:hypothetical protein